MSGSSAEMNQTHGIMPKASAIDDEKMIAASEDVSSKAKQYLQIAHDKPRATMSARKSELARKDRGCRLIVDSTSDFNLDVLHRLEIEVIPLCYVGPDGEHVDDLWETASSHDFYESMRRNPNVRYTTEAVSPGKYLEVFEAAAKEGTPTVYLCLSGGLSSSINAAYQAAETIKETYPDFELYVLDNCCDSAAGELLAIEFIRQAHQGLTAAELYAWAKDARFFIHGYFMVDSLHWLALGGRIPAAAAQIGGKLDVKPELSYDTRGALTLRTICRGRRKALRAIMDDFRRNYAYDPSLAIAIVSADAEKDADWLEAQVRRERGCEKVTIIRSSVSPILGAHVGPGMVALIFWGIDRRERLTLTDRIARRIKNGDTGES